MTTSPSGGATDRRAKLRAAQAAEAKRARARRIVIAVVSLVALVAAAVAIGVFIAKQNRDRNNAVTTGDPTAQITPPNSSTDGASIVVNPEVTNAPITLDVHFDYQCPGCAWVEAVYQAALEELAARGDISLRFSVHTFLDVVNRAGNPASSTRAAIAAACADTVGRFVPYHDAIFANQPAREGDGFSDDQLRTVIAAQAGIAGADLTRFQTCYDNRQTSRFVATMSELNSQNPNITYTPTFVINGKPMDGYSGLGQQPADADGFLAAIKRFAGLA